MGWNINDWQGLTAGLGFPFQGDSGVGSLSLSIEEQHPSFGDGCLFQGLGISESSLWSEIPSWSE